MQGKDTFKYQNMRRVDSVHFVKSCMVLEGIDRNLCFLAISSLEDGNY